MLEYWVALSIVRNMGLSVKHELLRKFGAPDKIFAEKIKKADFARLKEDVDLPKLCGKYLSAAQNIIRKCKNDDTAVICFADADYPKLLRDINYAPLVLYCKGDKEILSRRCVAIVGTREPNENGIKDTANLSAGLAKSGLVIVSGLARGVDTVAHESTLAAGGKTVAVMATGINKIHPMQNITLAKRIAAGGGALISEQRPDEMPFAPNFVQRNRIISGLCECSVIVSAPERSGALITGDFAQKQGRKVLVVPGTISDEKYKGSNKLLLKSDVCAALAVEGILDYLNGTKTARQIGIFDVPEESSAIAEKTDADDFGLSAVEKSVLSAMGERPVSVQDLSEKTNIGVEDIYGVLFDLEERNIVKQTADGRYLTLR